MKFRILVLAIRSQLKNRTSFAINLIGLIISFVAAYLIILLVMEEKSYDRFHENPNDLYRIGLYYQMGETAMDIPLAMSPLGPALLRQFPDIISFTRIDKPRNSILFSVNDQVYYEDYVLYVDSGFFKTFSFELINGNPEELLRLPHTCVIKEKTGREVNTSEQYNSISNYMGN